MSCVKVGMHATAGLLHPPPLWRRSSLGWRGSSLKVFNGARLPAAADRGGKGVRTMAFAIVRGSSRRIQNVLDVRFAKIENVPECSGPARASMSSQLGPLSQFIFDRLQLCTTFASQPSGQLSCRVSAPFVVVIVTWWDCLESLA
jgi:hypothetical protein